MKEPAHDALVAQSDSYSRSSPEHKPDDLPPVHQDTLLTQDAPPEEPRQLAGLIAGLNAGMGEPVQLALATAVAGLLGATALMVSSLINRSTELHVAEINARPRCEPGRTNECRTPTGASGGQTCSPTGTSWSACLPFVTVQIVLVAPTVSAPTTASDRQSGEGQPEPPPDESVARRQIEAERQEIFRNYARLAENGSQENVEALVRVLPEEYATVRTTVDQVTGDVMRGKPLSRVDFANRVKGFAGRYSLIRVTVGSSTFETLRPGLVVHRYPQRYEALNGDRLVYADCGTKALEWRWQGHAWVLVREWQEDAGLCA
jgi:hypothetical protein